MAAGKRPFRVLVAGGSSKLCESLMDLLPRNQFEFVQHSENAAHARRAMLEADIDLVIIVSPLRDEFGTQLAIDLSDSNVGVLLVVENDVYDQVCYKTEEFGVMTLGKPISRQSFTSAVRLLSALRSKLLQMERKQQALQEKMQDIRTVNRAKWLLIEHLKISEEEAHYLIEKQAMNRRLSRREIAEEFIRTYS